MKIIINKIRNGFIVEVSKEYAEGDGCLYSFCRNRTELFKLILRITRES